MKKLLTADEVADSLSVGVRTVYDWAAGGHIPAIRLGPGTLRFDPDAIEAWVLGQTLGLRTAEPARSAPSSSRVDRLRAGIMRQAQVSDRRAS